MKARKIAHLTACCLILWGCLAGEYDKAGSFSDLTLHFNPDQLTQLGGSDVKFTVFHGPELRAEALEAEAVVNLKTAESGLTEFTGLRVGEKRLAVALLNEGGEEIDRQVLALNLKSGVRIAEAAEVAFGNSDAQRNTGNGSNADSESDSQSTSNEQKSVTVSVQLLLRGDGADVSVSYLDVKPWLQADCTTCHGATKQSGGIDLSRFPFTLDGTVPADSSALNQKVVDSLTGAYGVSPMPRVRGLSPEEARWDASRIQVMERWAESGFLADARDPDPVQVDDVVGTVKVLLKNPEKDTTLLATVALQDRTDASVFIAKGLVPLGTTELSIAVLVYDLDGKIIAQGETLSRPTLDGSLIVNQLIQQ